MPAQADLSCFPPTSTTRLSLPASVRPGRLRLGSTSHNPLLLKRLQTHKRCNPKSSKGILLKPCLKEIPSPQPIHKVHLSQEWIRTILSSTILRLRKTRSIPRIQTHFQATRTGSAGCFSSASKKGFDSNATSGTVKTPPLHP